MGRFSSAFVSVACVQMLEIQAAICDNWNETQCSDMNDGGCSCYWNTTSCSKNTSDCSGVGITSVGSNCTLTGGEEVSEGWAGQDTGYNCCNSCSCLSVGLACTKMFCVDFCNRTLDVTNDTMDSHARFLAKGFALPMSLLFTQGLL